MPKLLPIVNQVIHISAKDLVRMMMWVVWTLALVHEALSAALWLCYGWGHHALNQAPPGDARWTDTWESDRAGRAATWNQNSPVVWFRKGLYGSCSDLSLVRHTRGWKKKAVWGEFCCELIFAYKCWEVTIYLLKLAPVCPFVSWINLFNFVHGACMFMVLF